MKFTWTFTSTFLITQALAAKELNIKDNVHDDPSTDDRSRLRGNKRQERKSMSHTKRSLYGTKVIGGVDAGIGEYTWFAKGLGFYVCGGSLVTPNLVLTAAHCPWGQGLNGFQIGGLCDEEDNCGQQSETFGIGAVYNHPNYNEDTFANDFALVKLDGKSNIQPVTIDPSSSYMGGEQLWTLGFGDTDPGVGVSFPDHLQHVSVSYIPQEACEDSYSSTPRPILDSMMCAADPFEDACGGDSGGPLYDKNSQNLVGIVSWGKGCARREYPGVYSRISDQWNEWIKPTICDNSDPKPAFCKDTKDPPTDPSCMSGDTGLIKIQSDPKIHARHADAEQPHMKIVQRDTTHEVKKLKELRVGDRIQGLNDYMQPDVCTVEAIGTFGHGLLYGNYTEDHFVYSPETRRIEQHGPIGEPHMGDKYEIFTSCPLGVDESGKKFTPIDSDFCGRHLKDMSWSDYVQLHRAILRVVRKTGGYWFSGSTYSNMERLHDFSAGVCRTMLQCVKYGEDCDEFETAAILFIENTLTEPMKRKTYGSFTNAGRSTKHGSISDVVTGGRSVR